MFKYKLLKIKDLVGNLLSRKQVHYVVETAAWSIRHDGQCLTALMDNARITTEFRGLRNTIIHFGSLNTFITENGIRNIHPSNQVIVTCFHINPGDVRNQYIKAADKVVSLWHTSCSSTKKELIEIGIPEVKITTIPLGVDREEFRPVDKNDKARRRAELGIPDGAFVIGSFQKDGKGWGEGLEPKLIKGPDVFCDVLAQLKENGHMIFALLTGPARGYVKNRLEKAGIPYRHDFLASPNDVADYYKASDLYIITSREEGGPKSILESWASGVPLVSTKVGMAPDIVRPFLSHGDTEGKEELCKKNALLCDIEDVEGLADACEAVIEKKINVTAMIENALADVKNFDWSVIAERYEKELYERE